MGSGNIFLLNRLSFVGSAFWHKFHMKMRILGGVFSFQIFVQSEGGGWNDVVAWFALCCSMVLFMQWYPLLTEYFPAWLPVHTSWSSSVWGLIGIVKISSAKSSSKCAATNLSSHLPSSLLISSDTIEGSLAFIGPSIIPLCSHLSYWRLQNLFLSQSCLLYSLCFVLYKVLSPIKLTARFTVSQKSEICLYLRFALIHIYCPHALL